MLRTKKRKTDHGLGPRYGRTVRKRWFEIEADLKKRHRCKKCSAKAVKRVSVGVWKCSKCGVIFSGGAYTPSSEIGEVAKRSVEATITTTE